MDITPTIRVAFETSTCVTLLFSLAAEIVRKTLQTSALIPYYQKPIVSLRHSRNASYSDTENSLGPLVVVRLHTMTRSTQRLQEMASL